jgi:hypothetical protein
MVDRVDTLEATLARLGGTLISASAPRAHSQERPTMSTQARPTSANMDEPYPDETREDFIARCTGQGSERDQCEMRWDQAKAVASRQPHVDVAAGQIVVTMAELQALRDKASRADRLEDLRGDLEREAAANAERLAAHRQEKIAFKLRGVKLPAFRPFMRALLEMASDAPGAKTYVVTDAKNPVTAEGVIDALIAEINHQAEGIFKTFSAHVAAPRPDPDEPEEIQARIDYRVKQYCRANKLDPAKDYKAALEAVLNSDAQLKAAYTAV